MHRTCASNAELETVLSAPGHCAGRCAFGPRKLLRFPMIAAMPVRAHRSVVAALAFLSILPLSACQKPTRAQYDATNGWSTFGTLVETFREVDPEITAADVGTHAGSNQRVVLSGFVADVCQTMGCWLEIEDDAGAKVLVMNKDHAFFIPRNARGRPVHAIGWVVVEEHSVDFLKHLAMDAGRTQVEIDAITEPKTRTIFIAESVILPPGGLEKAPVPLPAETEVPASDTSMTPATAEPLPAEPTAPAGQPATTGGGNW